MQTILELKSSSHETTVSLAKITEKTDKKPATFNVFLCLFKMIKTLFLRIFNSKYFHRKQRLQVQSTTNTFFDYKASGKFVTFITLLMNILKFYEILRFRSIFRSFHRISDQELEIINDITYFKKMDDTQNNKFHFITNKYLRKFIRSLKKFSKKYIDASLRTISNK